MQVSCPHCQRILHVPADGAGQTGTCPGCGQRLHISRQQAKVAQPYRPQQRTTLAADAPEELPEVPYDDPPAPRMQPATKVALGFIGACLIGSCCLCGGVAPFLASRNLPPDSVFLSSTATPKKATDPADKDPYKPDCAIIRAYLKQRYGDVDIVSWGKRTIWNNEVLGGRAMLSCRFRRKGERHTMSADFTIGPYNTVEDAHIQD